METLTLLANELNAPLASRQALVTTLLEGDHGELPRKALESLQDVVETNTHLRRVISDALDIARLEHGQLPASIQKIRLHEVLMRAVREVEHELKGKGLTLTQEGSASSVISADPEHAHRILTAILRNAVDYTERGGVTVTCSVQQDQVVVTVADTGVGIQVANLGQLFAKPKLGSLLRGKGLSLYLARCLAKSMGSDVTLISSELENGSTFAVTFPRAVKANASVPDESDNPAMAKT
jgi:signal transduction histidine kinase